MRIMTFALAAALVLVPALAEAQNSKGKGRRGPRVVQVRRADCCWGNRFSLEPYAGAMKDAYDISPDGEDTGYLVGFRVGYALSNRTRLLGNVAYSETDNVSNPGGLPDYFMYDNNWVFTTAGAEFDVVPGRTSAALGLQGGVAWRKTDVDGSVGSPIGAPISDDGFASYAVLIPGLAVRHRFSSRWAAMVGLQDNIFDFLEGPAQHSLALTAGVAFR
jgi:hypothetical protein